MDASWTCGKGLAAHSTLPAKLAELMDAVAENLERHMLTLDRSDANARLEYAAYAALIGEHRTIARLLGTTARHMASYQNLPMGRHDPQALNDPALVSAFERLVELERGLETVLRQRLEEHGVLLGASRRVRGGG